MVSYVQGLLNTETVKILPYQVPKNKKKFGGTSSYGMVIIYFHNPTKSSLVVILRDQPSFYDYRLTRYGFCDFFVLSGQFPGYFWPTNHDTKYAIWFF